MLPHIKRLLMGSRFNPYRLAGNAAVYSLDGAPSDMTYIVDGSGRLQLVADRSGNSDVNCLVLNGAAGNYASTPDIGALSSVEIIVGLAAISYTPASAQIIACQADNTTTRQWFLELASTGHLILTTSPDGGAGAQVQSLSTEALSTAAYAAVFVRARCRCDNGAGGNTTTFEIGSGKNGPWVPLGNAVTEAGLRTIYNGGSLVEVGAGFGGTLEPFAGRFLHFQVGEIGAAPLLEIPFASLAKLSASGLASTGQTVTINTSGDTGARICGERDLVQLTQAKQPIVSVAADGVNIATFDGTDDYMKAAQFPLSQPESVYWVGSQESWTADRQLIDGNGENERMAFYNSPSTPEIRLFGGGPGPSVALPLQERAVVLGMFNGESSALGLNLGALTTGDGSVQPANGVTVGAKFDGSNPSNATVSEIVFAERADSKSLQLKIAGALMRKWRVQT